MGRRAVCSECGAPIPDARDGQYTCGVRACRKARERRLAKAKNATPPEGRPGRSELAQLDHASLEAVAGDVIREELRPLVREALSDRVLDSLNTLVGLTPLAIEALKADLEGPDPELRHKAATLLLKYSLGNPAIAPQGADAQPAPLQVNFNIPRPGDNLEHGDPVPKVEDADADELRECAECGEFKPPSDFVAGSDRCTTCHTGLLERVTAQYGPQ